MKPPPSPASSRHGNGIPEARRARIVARRDRAYVMGSGVSIGTGAPMADLAAVPQRTGTRVSRPLILVAGAVGVLLAGTVALWAHYGTAVFYEMILAGIALCM